MKRFLDVPEAHITRFNEATDGASRIASAGVAHVFDRDSMDAVNAALAADRPLLVRGEPGVGKTQLARAVAKELGRAYVQCVVDVRTESRDLLWHFDTIRRLADAQLDHASRGDLGITLALEEYLHPRALWWAFDWEGALRQAQRVKAPSPENSDGGDPAQGCVVLIDEIDKGESDVPNGLLEALGSGRFTPEGRAQAVCVTGPSPLVVVTTNEERALPDAFLRRCLVLPMQLPSARTEPNALASMLCTRGQAHFPDIDDSVMTRAAEIVVDDRKDAEEQARRQRPGQAEFLDLLRAVRELHSESSGQRDALEQVARFTVQKYSSRLE